MGKYKKYLLAFLLALTTVQVAFAVAQTTFTDVKITKTLTVVGAVTAGSVNCSNVSTTTLTANDLIANYGVKGSTAVFNGGNVAVSTSTTSTDKLYFAGAFATLPTTGYNRGTLAVQTSDMKLYISTETVATSGSWKSVGSQ